VLVSRCVCVCLLRSRFPSGMFINTLPCHLALSRPLPENMTVYDFWTVVRDSVNVALQMCAVLLFVMVFLFMLEHSLSARALITYELAFLVVGFLAHWVFDPVYRGWLCCMLAGGELVVVDGLMRVSG
jgi:Phosphatidylinositol N-acetylglucosaminyltransferase